MPKKQPAPGELDAIETASRDEVQALQLQRLRWSLKHAYDNVPHYRKAFDDKGVHPDDLKQLSDLAKFPFTTKKDLRDNMLNGHAICHGGYLAALADTAFAYACNSYNELTVASGFAIELLAPGRLGDVLTARCTEVSKAGRTGVYDTEITNQRGERVAVFRGRSYTMKGKPAVPARDAG